MADYKTVLKDFELFTGRHGEPRISLTKHGRLIFNRAINEKAKIKESTYALLYFNLKKMQLGIKLVTNKQPFSLKVTLNKNLQGRLNLNPVLKAYEIEFNNRDNRNLNYKYFENEDVIIIDLLNEVTVKSP
jgi:hypothetical protein